MAKAQKPAPVVIEAKSPSQEKGRLKLLGGSASDAFNSTLANQVVRTLWLDHADADECDKLRSAAVAGLVGIAPKDELEGMSRASSSPLTAPPWSATGVPCCPSRPSRAG